MPTALIWWKWHANWKRKSLEPPYTIFAHFASLLPPPPQEMVTHVKTRLTQQGMQRAVLSNLCEEILELCCTKTTEK